jgi:hypothetical protein
MNENDKGEIPLSRRHLLANLLSYVLPIAFLVSIPWYLFYRPVEVTRGPWQVLDPRKPADEPLKFEVIEEGDGTVIEPGDLIQVSMWFWSSGNNSIEQRDDDWWIWIGFQTDKETPFHSINPKLVSAFVGLKEGGGVRFTDSPTRDISAGEVYVNPFGSFKYYSSNKSGYSNKWRIIYVPTSISGYTIVHIKKVFKGQLKYRTTRLYDDTWIRYCLGLFNCEFINTPREGWVDEARFDGVSNDGKRATFQYGPIATPGKEWKGPGRVPVAEGWFNNEWKKLPVGVQVK